MNCQLCGKPLDQKKSRGFCDECFSKILNNRDQLKEEIIDNIDLPVIVIDDNLNTFTANNSLLEFIDKSLSEVAGQLGGDVFNCKYTELEGGCGKTQFCDDCEIRNLVVKTLKEGVPCKEESVRLFLVMKGREIETMLSISTKIIENKVFLQINDVDFIG